MSSNINTEEKITGVNLDTHLAKGLPFVRELFFTVQSRIFLLDDNIQEKVTKPYIGYKVSKMFTEVHIQKNRLLLYLRPIVYNDPENRTSKVPESHNWVLDRRIFINNVGDIDYVMSLVEQSYKDIL
ncbi:MAG: hypothetical protein EOP46_17035 [Sphingobacteriaceae bacterium]|nr:MAG: hypothetical protein EOP46_17035 [Sphingobacteriaceae bacterium]